MPKIKLDIININKVIIYFESKMSLSLINIIQIFISINIENFYIVNIFTLFFLFVRYGYI